MRLFGVIPIPSPRRLFRMGWFKTLFIWLLFIALLVGIWIGFPMFGVAILATVWLRATLIGLLVFAVLLRWILKWRKRRKAAADLEEELMPAPVGDGEVLAEHMAEALAKLKKSGGKTYLYDLPWYVIIGPPGAGKTTALANSGIEFPGSDNAIEGFGGTRNCDWWFAEDAVLIDTAGRYTTQDSDAEADSASWSSFLEILKRGRVNEPINGVILAFSAEDMMTATPETLADHAETVRKRLSEIHETLKIDFPVYVMFTKADLISGFREYFGSYTQARRKAVWGATFQTRDKTQETYQEVGREFDKLLGRLSDEVIDRMAEEQDGINRVAVFGLPGQMGLLRDNVADFLRRVFEPTRYKTNAILRGFYFTSGTQEGTPIDQVLGAMARNDGADPTAFQPAFMSGKGKSFFLHDLLKQVIFAERDWVSHDAAAVRRGRIWRSLGMSFVTVATLGVMAAFGWSYWQNATLLDASDQQARNYFETARPELQRELITNDTVRDILGPLQTLRTMPAGYENDERPPYWARLGLSQQRGLRNSATRAYSEGLERLLRPRLILHAEVALRDAMAKGDPADIYSALEVYMLLSGLQPADMEPDDATVQAYFAGVWANLFASNAQREERDIMNGHLEAMLELDGWLRDSDRLPIERDLITQAQITIADLDLDELAYADIRAAANSFGLADFRLIDQVGGRVEDALATTDGAPLSDLTVSGLYTFDGYWNFFSDAMTNAKDRLEDKRWVLEDQAERVNYDGQLGSLEQDLQLLYRRDFEREWQDMLSRITVANLTVDPQTLNGLDALQSSNGSPLLKLVEAVEYETRLSRFYELVAAFAASEDSEGGGTLAALGDAAFSRIYNQSDAFGRVLLEQQENAARPQNQVGGPPEGSERRQVELHSDVFADWHALLNDSGNGRPIDGILQNISEVYLDRRTAGNGGLNNEAVLQELLTQLTNTNSAFPPTIRTVLNGIEDQFRSASQDSTLDQLNTALRDEVTAFCQRQIEDAFPFGVGNHVPTSDFGEFFGYGGIMDRFYTERLSDFVRPGANGLEPRSESAVGQRINPAALRAFDQAQAIRSAFFAPGSKVPEVLMQVTYDSSSPAGVVPFLDIHGTILTLQFGGVPRPVPVTWPGTGTGVTLQLTPAISGRSNVLSYTGGRWAIVEFMREATTPRDTGNSLRLTHGVGGRSVTFVFQFDANTVPFLMPELEAFSCPTGLN